MGIISDHSRWGAENVGVVVIFGFSVLLRPENSLKLPSRQNCTGFCTYQKLGKSNLDVHFCVVSLGDDCTAVQYPSGKKPKGASPEHPSALGRK
jgi:hypothetical protein